MKLLGMTSIADSYHEAGKDKAYEQAEPQEAQHFPWSLVGNASTAYR